MFGRKFGQCSGEQSAVFGGSFFTGARAARFPTPVTTSNFSWSSSHGPYRARAGK